MSDADVLANQAIGLARAHRTLPTPPVFHVWYEYADGSNSGVIEQVDNILKTKGIISTFDIEQIHDNVISKDINRRVPIEDMSNRLGKGLAEILHITESHIHQSAALESDLSSKEISLINFDIQILRSAIKNIIKENRKMRDETIKLNSYLQGIQEQNNSLRIELEKSRLAELTDSLTGVKNRRGFSSIMQLEMNNAIENKTDMCLILADIDKFKVLNDSFGHIIGDEVLKYIANVFKEELNGAGEVCRYGGEEFALILPGMKIAQAYIYAENIRKKVECSKLFVMESKESLGKITASFGIAELFLGDDITSIINRADVQLYNAKSIGRNKVLPFVR